LKKIAVIFVSMFIFSVLGLVLFNRPPKPQPSIVMPQDVETISKEDDIINKINEIQRMVDKMNEKSE
jgi:hypothetical protein